MALYSIWIIGIIGGTLLAYPMPWKARSWTKMFKSISHEALIGAFLD